MEFVVQQKPLFGASIVELIRVGGYVIKSANNNGAPPTGAPAWLWRTLFGDGPASIWVGRDVADFIFQNELFGDLARERGEYWVQTYREMQRFQREHLVEIVLPTTKEIDEFTDLLDKYLKETATVSADGAIVVTMPPIWFRDP